jgi:hypothetical protein
MTMCWLQQSAQLWSYPTFVLVPLMVVGTIECFAGYRAWRFLLGLNGAVLGFVAGAMVSLLLGSPILVLVGGIGGGIAGAILFAGVAPVGTFIFTFGSIASLTILLAHIAGTPSRWIMPLAAGAGLAAATLALNRCRYLMIAVAAIAGAQQIASAWRAHQLPHGALPLPEIVTQSEAVAFIALAAVGLLVQFADVRLIAQKTPERLVSIQSKAASGHGTRQSGLRDTD